MVQGASALAARSRVRSQHALWSGRSRRTKATFDMQVAWPAPAHHVNPLQLVKSVSFHDAGGNLGSEDEEGADN